MDEVRASRRSPKTLGLKVQLVRGDTPVEKGPGEGLVVAQKMIADSRLVAVIGPATSGARRLGEQGVVRGRASRTSRRRRRGRR